MCACVHIPTQDFLLLYKTVRWEVAAYSRDNNYIAVQCYNLYACPPN